MGASRKIATDPISISNEDGAAILRACARTAKKEPALFALDQSDVRHIGQRTVVRTEACEVEVEVPDRDVEGETEATSAARRMSIKTQALLSQLGAILKRIPVILKHSLRERNSWRIRLGLVVG